MNNTSAQGRMWETIVRRLERLECAIVPHSADSFMASASHDRIRLFEWLLLRFDPSLVDSAQTQAVGRVSKITSSLKLLGVSSENDAHAVEGLSSPSESDSNERQVQLVMLARLIDLVELAVTSPTLSAVEDRFNQDVKFVRALAVDHKTVFGRRLSLFDQSFQSELVKEHRPDEATLSSSIDRLRSTIDKLDPVLAEWRARVDAAPFDWERTSEGRKKIEESLAELCKAASTFSSAYSSELKPWLDQQPPVEKMTPIGTQAVRVGELVERLRATVQHLRSLENTSERISTTLETLERLAIETQLPTSRINDHAMTDVKAAAKLLSSSA